MLKGEQKMNFNQYVDVEETKRANATEAEIDDAKKKADQYRRLCCCVFEDLDYHANDPSLKVDLESYKSCGDSYYKKNNPVDAKLNESRDKYGVISLTKSFEDLTTPIIEDVPNESNLNQLRVFFKWFNEFVDYENGIITDILSPIFFEKGKHLMFNFHDDIVDNPFITKLCLSHDEYLAGVEFVPESVTSHLADKKDKKVQNFVEIRFIVITNAIREKTEDDDDEVVLTQVTRQDDATLNKKLAAAARQSRNKKPEVHNDGVPKTAVKIIEVKSLDDFINNLDKYLR